MFFVVSEFVSAFELILHINGFCSVNLLDCLYHCKSPNLKHRQEQKLEKFHLAKDLHFLWNLADSGQDISTVTSVHLSIDGTMWVPDNLWCLSLTAQNQNKIKSRIQTDRMLKHSSNRKWPKNMGLHWATSENTAILQNGR